MSGLNDPDIARGADRLVRAVRRMCAREAPEGMGEAPPDTVMCIAVLALSRLIAGEDERAALRGIGRAVASASQACGVSKDDTLRGLVAAVRSSFAAGGGPEHGSVQ